MANDISHELRKIDAAPLQAELLSIVEGSKEDAETPAATKAAAASGGPARTGGKTPTWISIRST